MGLANFFEKKRKEYIKVSVSFEFQLRGKHILIYKNVIILEKRGEK